MSTPPFELGDMLRHVADQPVDAKRIKGLSIPITGRVASGATIDGGTGFTVSTGGTGLYTVTFTTAFAAVPTVIVTGIRTGGTRNANLLTVATTGFDIDIRSDAGGLADAAFHFVAYETT